MKKPTTYWFENSKGKRVGFHRQATIADLVKAGVTDIAIVPKKTKPTVTRYIHRTEDVT